jgi:hypothetical protein
MGIGADARRSLSYEISTAGRPIDGETVSGDMGRVFEERGGGRLVALADGLGHGEAAALAAARFCEVVERRLSESLESILQAAAADLAGTRGAAGALLRLLPHGRLEFAGVGNVGLMARTLFPVSAFSTAGILGRRIRTVRTFEASLSVGDDLILYTDGVSLRSDLDGLPWGASAIAIARAIVRDHGKPTDDATCMVVRCLDPSLVRQSIP